MGRTDRRAPVTITAFYRAVRGVTVGDTIEHDAQLWEITDRKEGRDVQLTLKPVTTQARPALTISKE